MSNQKPTRNVAHHILPTSANLLGICFLIFSLVHLRDNPDASLLDEFSALAIVVFLIASICSYMSLRSEHNEIFERIADVSFILGLCILTAAAVLLTLRFVH
jgi:hypothetical protein